MSETATEELAPLAPAEEVQDPDAQAEAAEPEAEAVEAQDRFSKPLQKVQMENANLRRDVAELKTLILQQAAKPQTAAAKDRLESMLEEAKTEYGESNPGLMKIVNALADELREGKATRSDLQRKLEEVQGVSAYENFMAGRSSQFRTEFSEAQAELVASAMEEFGEKPSIRELRLAMTGWVKNWDKSNQPQTTTKPNAPSAPRRSTVIPTGAGARNQSQISLADALASGKVPDGRGGYRSGNVLGI